MKYISEFRDSKLVKPILESIHQIPLKQNIKIMEICGGHTIAIFKYGIRSMLPANIDLISGPGCPVCVTGTHYIDHVVALSRLNDVVIASFGDLLRVPGSTSSLLQEKSRGANIQICYSPIEALEYAQKNPHQRIIFCGIGFETTAPVIAAVVKQAKLLKIKNFFILSAHKTIPNALKTLAESKEIALNALICPGHVSAITGLKLYDFLVQKYQLPCVITGFEPLDLLQSILLILQQLHTKMIRVENQYKRCVPEQGNVIAQQIINEVFVPVDVEWRGLGIIPGSGLTLSSNYLDFDAAKQISVEIEPTQETPGCICGQIMCGIKKPTDCTLFKKICTPQNPQGSCMVSGEGTCATYFKYNK